MNVCSAIEQLLHHGHVTARARDDQWRVSVLAHSHGTRDARWSWPQCTPRDRAEAEPRPRGRPHSPQSAISNRSTTLAHNPRRTRFVASASAPRSNSRRTTSTLPRRAAFTMAGCPACHRRFIRTHSRCPSRSHAHRGPITQPPRSSSCFEDRTAPPTSIRGHPLAVDSSWGGHVQRRWRRAGSPRR